MLEGFVYKTFKKRQLAKKLREANAKEALSQQDEEFIRQTIDDSNSPQGREEPVHPPESSIATPTVEEKDNIQAEDGKASAIHVAHKRRRHSDIPGTRIVKCIIVIKPRG